MILRVLCLAAIITAILLALFYEPPARRKGRRP